MKTLFYNFNVRPNIANKEANFYTLMFVVVLIITASKIAHFFTYKKANKIAQ
jgi:hypothetical protein